MSVSTKTPDYHVGKEYPSKSITLASLLAWVSYVFAAFLLFIAICSFYSPNPASATSSGSALTVSIVALVFAIGFTVLHAKRPQRRFTALNTFYNQNGDFAAQVRYLDGTENTLVFNEH